MKDIYKYLVRTANLISRSRFRNKMILKGGSVLISKLIENNRTEFYRRTTDLDIHCDKKEVWIDFYTNIVNILNNNEFGYIYTITERRSEKKGLNDSDSLKFELFDTKLNNKVEFKMDMNIKSNTIITCEYSPILNMTTYDVLTMLSDKITVVSSEKIYRRIKDLYDLCVMISMYDISYDDIIKHIRVKHPDDVLKNMLVQENMEKIAHAFEKFDGILHKPDIIVLISIASAFLQPFYWGINNSRIIWRKDVSSWISF